MHYDCGYYLEYLSANTVDYSVQLLSRLCLTTQSTRHSRKKFHFLQGGEPEVSLISPEDETWENVCV